VCLKKKKAARKAWVVEMADLKGQLDRKTGTLAAGWKQRLALGCAVLHEPSILFLDEPTAGVDPITRRQFWNLIYDMADSGMTIFVTTHYMDEAEYFDSICLIYQGKIIAQGTPAQLKKEVMREQILGITCNHPQDMMEIIRTLPEVKEAALFGRGMHIVVEDAGDAMKAKLLETIVGNGGSLDTIEKIDPSLEDVFVSLIESHDRLGGIR